MHKLVINPLSTSPTKLSNHGLTILWEWRLKGEGGKKKFFLLQNRSRLSKQNVFKMVWKFLNLNDDMDWYRGKEKKFEPKKNEI